MSLRRGAETVVTQCLNVQPDEHVVVVNDGNDPALIDALLPVVEDHARTYEYREYDEPANHGTEPPEDVAVALSQSDVFIAPTKKSITHTQARIQACANGARGATMPTVTKEIWRTSLLADYRRVSRLTNEVYDLLRDAREVRVTTPRGTDVTFTVEPSYYIADTGLIHEAGDFGNLPAGEAFGTPVGMSGTLVLDQNLFAPEGTRVEVEDSTAVAVEHVDNTASELARVFDERPCSVNVAEFGVGTNPQATLINNMLQDEKVLGTIHIAFGDNTSMVPDDDPRQQSCDIHWDLIFQEPTVTLDGTPLLRDGKPLFTE